MPMSIRYDKLFCALTVQYGLATWTGDNKEPYERLVDHIDQHVKERVQIALNRNTELNKEA